MPSTERVKPQTSEQVAIGIAKDFTERNFSLSIEGYYKKMTNIIGYKDGASFLFLDFGSEGQRTSEVDWQDNVTSGRGKAYGFEFLLQRKTGRLTGWIGYTLSWIKHQFDDKNEGREYSPRYDHRHDASIVTTYKLNPSITFSATWVFSSGDNLTIPIASSFVHGISTSGSGFDGLYRDVSFFGEFNSFQAAAYHRLDLGIKFHKKKKRGERTWEIGVYNAYNRINPFFYESSTDSNQERKLYRQGLFPLIPSLTYSFKF
ncbi:MAG: hypothetical protein ORN54_13555 [Cyclobacteriaceae bacterium]|nr:hypothetical protein [Cyclobacteriaceae bacterium]